MTVVLHSGAVGLATSFVGILAGIVVYEWIKSRRGSSRVAETPDEDPRQGPTASEVGPGHIPKDMQPDGDVPEFDGQPIFTGDFDDPSDNE